MWVDNENDSVQFVQDLREICAVHQHTYIHTHTHPSISDYGYLRMKLLILFFLSI